LTNGNHCGIIVLIATRQEIEMAITNCVRCKVSLNETERIVCNTCLFTDTSVSLNSLLKTGE
jgi:hypothetical protein